MTTREESLKTEVLGDLRSEDLPLHEVWLMACRFAELKLNERLALAESVVMDLLDSGDVQLKKGTWNEWPTPEAEPLSPEEIASVLREYIAWVPQQDPMYFLVS